MQAQDVATVTVPDDKQEVATSEELRVPVEEAQEEVTVDQADTPADPQPQVDQEEEMRRRIQEELLTAEPDLHPRSFELIARLGGGSFGTVYRVKLQNGALVALKFVLLNNSYFGTEGAFDRFIDEAVRAQEEFKRIQKLRHPNVVLGIGASYGRFPGETTIDAEDGSVYGPFAFMIFSELGANSLKNILTDTAQGLINEENINGESGRVLLCRFAFETTDALCYMHENGVVHHDIKPDNVLVSPDNHVRITDFGISAESSYVASIHSGTRVYNPPESRRLLEGAHMDTTKKDVYAVGLTLLDMLRIVGGEDGACYWRSGEWSRVVPEDTDESPKMMAHLDGDQREELLRAELAHVRGSEAARLVDGMLLAGWEERLSMKSVRVRLLRCLQDPDSLYDNRPPPTNDQDQDEDLPPPPEVPPPRLEVEQPTTSEAAWEWIQRVLPVMVLLIAMIVAFVVESQHEDSKKDEDEFRNMVAATTAGFVFSTAAAALVTTLLTCIHQTLFLRYFLLVLVIVGTMGFGIFLQREDAVAVGALFITYSVSQLFTIWHVAMQSEFGELQRVSELQSAFCNKALLDNLTRAELAGLLTPTLLFQLAILYAGITIVKSLPTNAGEVLVLAVLCWVVNLPRYFAHFSLVRAMTDAVNLCHKVRYAETLRQTFWKINNILGWSLLAVQQPVWSVLEMAFRTMIKAAHILIVTGAAILAEAATNDDGNCCDSLCGCAGSICLFVGSCALPVAKWLKRGCFKLSVYCSKLYITLIAFDPVFGGSDKGVYAKLQLYSNEKPEGLLYFANKGIAASNAANFCILLGCCAAMIASQIYVQAALYGYLAGYLAASTVLEVQSSMYLWFLAVMASGDDDVCPEAMLVLRETLVMINKDFTESEEAAAPPVQGPQRQGYAGDIVTVAPPDAANAMPHPENNENINNTAVPPPDNNNDNAVLPDSNNHPAPRESSNNDQVAIAVNAPFAGAPTEGNSTYVRPG